MTHDEFLTFVKEWSEGWKDAHAAGEEGFGTESTLQDWLGSLEAYGALSAIADSGALPKTAVEQIIDIAQKMEQDRVSIRSMGPLCPKCQRYFMPCPVCK